MCLEIYSKNQPVQIPYENEFVRFLTPTKISTRYTLLIRNVGYTPIDDLIAIYPRKMRDLYSDENGIGFEFRYLEDHCATDITSNLKNIEPFCDSPNKENEILSLSLADPNNPVCLLSGVNGLWLPGSTINPLPTLKETGINFLNMHGFMAWELKLPKPIEPNTSRWVLLEINNKDAGYSMNTFDRKIVYHELSSPIDVHRTLSETIQTSIRDLHLNEANLEPSKIKDHEIAYRDLLYSLRLNQPRQVDIQYYELAIATGNPREQYLMNMTRTGDIRPRTGSPRIGKDAKLDRDFLGQPIYEWKSGSIIEPAHPWRNSGFSLRLTLASPLD